MLRGLARFPRVGVVGIAVSIRVAVARHHAAARSAGTVSGEDVPIRHLGLRESPARGRQAPDAAGDRVAEIKQRWSQIAGPARFADTCRTLQDLLDRLSDADT